MAYQCWRTGGIRGAAVHMARWVVIRPPTGWTNVQPIDYVCGQHLSTFLEVHDIAVVVPVKAWEANGWTDHIPSDVILWGDDPS